MKTPHVEAAGNATAKVSAELRQQQRWTSEAKLRSFPLWHPPSSPQECMAYLSVCCLTVYIVEHDSAALKLQVMYVKVRPQQTAYTSLPG